MAALDELDRAYEERRRPSAAFQTELADLLKDFARRRPTPLYFAKRLTEQLGGAKIYLKREDLLHTGAHKINNALGQGLLAKRMGKKRAGSRRLALGSMWRGYGDRVRAAAGLECVVFTWAMWTWSGRSCEREAHAPGAGARWRCAGVSSGSKTC